MVSTRGSKKVTSTMDTKVGCSSAGSAIQKSGNAGTTSNHQATTVRTRAMQASTSPEVASERINENHQTTKVDEIEETSFQIVLEAKQKEGINENLPPMNNPSDIFEDLLEHALREGFRGVLVSLAGRKIKIATMCSGTESPILACRLIADACSDQGLEFGYEHVFSAEIVPFKQAFIERNFKPPKLFRNITELGKGFKAETAYGASAELPVPGEVHILVAGFACVDFSRLNSQRKALNVSATDFGKARSASNTGTSAEDDDGPYMRGVDEIREEGGESSRTFRAIAKYARDYRPPIILLENIKNAPWIQIKEVFEGLGYSVDYVILDTKWYYLPQTRQRGYMICVSHRQAGMLGGMSDETATMAVQQWVNTMKALRRRASSPVEDFLLPRHSPLLARALEEAIRDQASGPTIKKEIDWAKCLGRHKRFRTELHVGDKTPYTDWNSGKSRMPEYALASWGKHLPARVKDVLDILALASATNNYDFEFKARYPDLSQNVDRGLDSAPPGIIGCLTPSGEPYSSIHGRPIVGIEALALQGLPIDRLHLTRETQKELQDLAGNAMTTPVVGAAILAALITAHGSISETTMGSIATTAQKVEDAFQSVTSSLPCKSKPLDFGPTVATHVDRLREMAKRSAKLCDCEDQSSLTSAPLFKCQECHSTACSKCAGIPSHNFQALRWDWIQPLEFRDALVKALPTRLILDISVSDFQKARDRIKSSQYDWSSWPLFIGTMEEALGDEVRLQSVKRGRCWTASYISLRLRLDLTFQAPRIQWALYAIPSSSMSVNAPIRILLKEPIARMALPASADSLLDGTWELNLPSLFETTIVIEGCGSLIPSWKSELGLEGFETARVWSWLRLKFENETRDESLGIIAGDYQLLRTCGTAKRALHVKKADDESLSPLYLFLDPDSIGPPTKDRFVVSPDPRRHYVGEAREVIARIGQGWSVDASCQKPNLQTDDKAAKPPEIQFLPEKMQRVRCTKHGSWVISEASLKAASDCNSSFIFPLLDLRDLILAFPHDASCRHTFVTVFKSTIPWYGPNPDGRRNGKQCDITEFNQEHMVVDLKWLTSRLPNPINSPNEWTPMILPSPQHRCHTCSPKQPRVKWKALEDEAGLKKSARGKLASTGSEHKQPTTSMVPFEDASEARPYENAIKARPSPFLIQIEANGPGGFQQGRNVTVSINIQALIHRALGILIATGLSEDSPGHIAVSWRLSTHFNESSRPLLSTFNVLSNKNDMPQPFTFDGIDPRTRRALKLRIEQQRSLQWMIKQDSVEADAFEEDIREESLSLHLDWRLEARVTKRRQVRGGIIADDVGYGKTVTMLALIKDRMGEAITEARSDSSNRIPLSATCIITPNTLIQQWKDEIQRFWPKCNVLAIKSLNVLEKATISQFQQAHIVLVSIGLLDKEAYTQRQAVLAALPEHPQLSSLRSWKAWYERSTERLETFTVQLKLHSTPSQFGRVLCNAAKEFELDTIDYNIIPSQRVKGDISKHNVQAASKSKPRSKPRVTRMEETHGFEEALDLGGVKHPVLGMFRFHRKVVDEQTYVDSRQLVAIQSLNSRSTWILSGTPSLRYFADVKRMASFLGVFLGIDDDTEGTMSKEGIRALRKDLTAAETFEAYKSSRSPAWYEARHQIAQSFLDRFARKNRAEFGEIHMNTIYQPVVLDGIHQTIYRELESQLVSEEAKITNKNLFGSLSHDRSRRFMDVLQQNPSRRAALVKLATIMPTGRAFSEANGENVIDGRARRTAHLATSTRQGTSYAIIEKAREADCQRMLALLRGLLEGVIVNVAVCSEEVKERFRKMIRFNAVTGHGDPDANKAIDDQFTPNKTQIAEVLVTIGTEKSKQKRAENSRLDPAKESKTRESLENVDRLFLAIVASIRAQRYLRRAFELQSLSQASSLSMSDCGCILRNQESRINRECGHCYCIDCLGHDAAFCPVTGCKARSLSSNVILSSELAVGEKGLANAHSDTKIDAISKLVRETSPYDQILVFVQFDDIGMAIETRFADAGIACFRVPRATSLVAQKQMSDFRKSEYGDPGWRKVLMLDPLDSSAAGHNLTNVHLIIFVSPILTETRDKYESAYLQAIGRARRHGQTRTVEVYHFVALNTADVNICEERSGQRLVHKDQQWFLEDWTCAVKSDQDHSSRMYSALEESYGVCMGDDAV